MTRSVALVTGASSGIGRATAIRLARDFEAVVLVARRRDELAGAAREIEALDAVPLIVEADLGRTESAEAVVGATLARFGRIDAVLNIAGAVPGIDLFQMTDDQWEASFALKFHGARRLTIRAWDALKATGGAVVFTSGTAAVTPQAATAAIGTINAAIEAMSKAFSERGQGDGVQVNAVAPGPVLTGRRRGLIEAFAAAKGLTFEEAQATLLAKAGITRYGTPEDVAELMAFAVSPASRWMTGTVLRMDGGEIKSV